MQRFTYTILARGTGLALRDALVTVYNAGTTDEATLYSANSTTSPTLNNPLTSDAFGEIAAYIPNGRYDLRVDYAGQTTRIIPDVQVFDWAEFNVAVGPLALVTGSGNQLAYFAGTNIVGNTDFYQLGRDILATADLGDLQDLLGITALGGVSYYFVPFGFTATPTSSEILLIHVFSRAVTFPVEFVGSTATIGTPPSSTCVLSVAKNGTTVATITISTLGAVTFDTFGDVAFAAGDVLRVFGPSTVPANLLNCAFNLLGERV
jgi:hypothetical protein